MGTGKILSVRNSVVDPYTVRILHILLELCPPFQFAGINLPKNLDRFDEFADSFEQLPMSFLRFHGPVPIKKVMDVMSHACYVHDITHIIVDNLQFMMHYSYTGAGGSSNFDRFQLQVCEIVSCSCSHSPFL